MYTQDADVSGPDKRQAQHQENASASESDTDSETDTDSQYDFNSEIESGEPKLLPSVNDPSVQCGAPRRTHLQPKSLLPKCVSSHSLCQKLTSDVRELAVSRTVDPIFHKVFLEVCQGEEFLTLAVQKPTLYSTGTSSKEEKNTKSKLKRECRKRKIEKEKQDKEAEKNGNAEQAAESSPELGINTDVTGVGDTRKFICNIGHKLTQ